MKFPNCSVFRLSKSALKWRNDHADEVHGGITGTDSYCMDKFSTEIYGVVLDATLGHGCSAVWLMSNYGEEIEFVEQKDMRKL